MNMHISISMRSTITAPINMTQVASIMQVTARVEESTLRLVHLSITVKVMAAGIKVMSESRIIQCFPAKTRHNITHQRYNGGLSA